VRVGRAFLWEFRRRHQLGLIALAGYLLLFSAIKFLWLGPGYPMRLDPPNGMAAFVFVPTTLTFLYFIGVFSYGLEGDLSARQSIYPPRMFTLPVTAAALAGWPMLYGTAAASSLYLLFALYMRLAGVSYQLPLVWPTLMVAVFIAWTQALVWMPYGMTGIRVVVTVLWLFMLDVVIIVAFEREASEAMMVALLAPNLPVAYFVAWVAVSRARRGTVPDWQSALSSSFDTVSSLTRRRRRFASAAQAQAWFERRRHARSLPWMVALVLPFLLWLLFVPGNDTPGIVTVTVILALLTPPFLAFFAAAMAGPQTPFMVTRPMTTADLAASKLKATLWSAVAAWVVTLIVIPVALMWSETWPTIAGPIGRAIRFVGMPHAIGIGALALGTLVATTWRQLNQSLCIGLTARPWLIKSTVVVALASLTMVYPAYRLLIRNAALQTAIWNGFPWVLMVLVAMKCGAGSWLAIRLHDRALLSERAIVTLAACWLAAVAALFAGLTWFAASPAIPRYLIGSIAILLVPLVRVSAVPLALSWSRHR
jgi:hypothetical protein